MGRLQGKVAIVTGGASEIGRGVVEAFVPGRRVGGGVRHPGRKGARLTAEIGPAVSYQRADVGEEPDVEALVAETVKRHGRLDCMVNNAGLTAPGGSILDTPGEAAEAAFASSSGASFTE